MSEEYSKIPPTCREEDTKEMYVAIRFIGSRGLSKERYVYRCDLVAARHLISLDPGELVLLTDCNGNKPNESYEHIGQVVATENKRSNEDGPLFVTKKEIEKAKCLKRKIVDRATDYHLQLACDHHGISKHSEIRSLAR